MFFNDYLVEPNGEGQQLACHHGDQLDRLKQVNSKSSMIIYFTIKWNSPNRQGDTRLFVKVQQGAKHCLPFDAGGIKRHSLVDKLERGWFKEG